MVEGFVPPVEGFMTEAGVRTWIAAGLLHAARNLICRGNPTGMIGVPAEHYAPQPPIVSNLIF
jgi:hypothetical protein